MERQRVSAIVLAGGRSSRFGGDKLAAMVAGRPLLHHAVSAVAAVADEVIVVLAADRDASLPDVAVPLRTVVDRDPYGGPLAGLRDGAEHAAHPILLLVGGDMPALRPAVLRQLITAVEAGHPAVVLGAPAGAEHRATLPMALARDQAQVTGARLLRDGERSLQGLLDALGAAVVPAAEWRALDPGAETLRDVDRPEDLPSAGSTAGAAVDPP